MQREDAMAASTPRKIKSAERTLALFELFSREQQPFTVGRIAQGLGMPQPSASMLLRNLHELGYLEYDAHSRTFTPSIRVALLGSWIDRRFGDAGAISVQLGALQRKIGFTAFIGIQNGAAAQAVAGFQCAPEPGIGPSLGAGPNLASPTRATKTSAPIRRA